MNIQEEVGEELFGTSCSAVKSASLWIRGLDPSRREAADVGCEARPNDSPMVCLALRESLVQSESMTWMFP